MGQSNCKGLGVSFAQFFSLDIFIPLIFRYLIIAGFISLMPESLFCQGKSNVKEIKPLKTFKNFTLFDSTRIIYYYIPPEEPLSLKLSLSLYKDTPALLNKYPSENWNLSPGFDTLALIRNNINAGEFYKLHNYKESPELTSIRKYLGISEDVMALILLLIHLKTYH